MRVQTRNKFCHALTTINIREQVAGEMKSLNSQPLMNARTTASRQEGHIEGITLRRRSLGRTHGDDESFKKDLLQACNLIIACREPPSERGVGRGHQGRLRSHSRRRQPALARARHLALGHLVEGTLHGLGEADAGG